MNKYDATWVLEHWRSFKMCQCGENREDASTPVFCKCGGLRGHSGMCDCGFHNDLSTNKVKASSVDGNAAEEWFDFMYRTNPYFSSIVDWSKSSSGTVDYKKIATMLAMVMNGYEVELE
jgi:hypothetical protein